MSRVWKLETQEYLMDICSDINGVSANYPLSHTVTLYSAHWTEFHTSVCHKYRPKKFVCFHLHRFTNGLRLRGQMTLCQAVCTRADNCRHQMTCYANRQTIWSWLIKRLYRRPADVAGVFSCHPLNYTAVVTAVISCDNLKRARETCIFCRFSLPKSGFLPTAATCCWCRFCRCCGMWPPIGGWKNQE